jgi:hypothetical protein
MSWVIAGPQRNTCPPEFQERVTQAGGVNRYGEPNFKIVWSETETMRAGGEWSHDGFIGYRDVPKYRGPGCWVILQWNAPELYGTPESYYVQNYDESSGLQTLGEFPYRGRYEILYALVHKERKGNELIIERMPLNNFLLTTVLPIVMNSRGVSYERKKLAHEELKAKQDEAELNQIEAARRDAAMAFGGNAFSSRTGCRTPLLDKKIKQIENRMAYAMAQMKSAGKGLSVRLNPATPQ